MWVNSVRKYAHVFRWVKMRRSPQWRSLYRNDWIYQPTSRGCFIKEKLSQVNCLFHVFPNTSAWLELVEQLIYFAARAISIALLIAFCIAFLRWAQTEWLLYWTRGKIESGNSSCGGKEWSFRNGCQQQRRQHRQQQLTGESVANCVYHPLKTLQSSRCSKSPWAAN